MRRFAARAKRTLYAIVFVLFTVFGVAMTVWGEGADRLWGIASVLMFGVGGAVYLALPLLT